MAWAGAWRVALVLAGAVAIAGCGSGGGDTPDVVPDERPVVVPDSGSPDAGPPDAGPPDAGPPDAGPPDAGPPDAGPQPLPAETYPPLPNWSFYGPEAGGPDEAFDVSTDQGGNIWVAGGEDGLFLLRKTASGYAERFERFTMEDGLRPYGYMKDGSAPPGTPYLKVVSVAGGPAGTVYVGYAGKPKLRTRSNGTTYLDADACESEAIYDNVNQVIHGDPSIYKSGDADRVSLTASGLKVVHYDISSGPGVVKGYPGREKVCTIHRLAYDPNTQSIWFGGNHGFARGEAGYAGNPTCNGQLGCSGVLEHVHPHIASVEGTPLTDAYFGVAPLPNGDVWFGGTNRSVKFLYGTEEGDYWAAQSQTEDAPYARNRLDIWADDLVETVPGEPGYPTYFPLKSPNDDLVSAMAVTGSGSVWISSFAHGLAHLSFGADGQPVIEKIGRGPLPDLNVSAMNVDPRDGSVWTGHRYGGGVARVGGSNPGQLWREFGAMSAHPVLRINSSGSGASRLMLFAFGASEATASTPAKAGALGIYTGP